MRVAIVGSGVTGLAATWLLNEYSEHEVHLYEADDRPGGHACTVRVAQPGKEPIEVDTAFIIFNPVTYTNFSRFLGLHKRTVESIEVNSTLSVSHGGEGVVWDSESLRKTFRSLGSIFDLGLWRMLFDLARFKVSAVRVFGEDEDVSISEYLNREGYSSKFKDDFLLPMTAAIWSTPPDVCANDFLAKGLVRFLYNHNFLRFIGTRPWRTIKGGSKNYVETILSKLPAEQLHLSTPVHAVSSDKGKAILVTATGKREIFDHIILACHSDDALRIVDAGGGATPEEREILSKFRWVKNDLWLHSDENLMPRTRLDWSTVNYLKHTAYDKQGKEKANDPHLSVTYWMNNIQSFPDEKHGLIFSTLSAPFPPSPKHAFGHYKYTHPILTGDGMRAQPRLRRLNALAVKSGRHRVFAGAWARYGGHEDGFTAGLFAAAAVPGVVPPFQIADVEAEGVPRAGLAAYVFDVLNFVWSYFVIISGSILLFLVVSSGAAKKVY